MGCHPASAVEAGTPVSCVLREQGEPGPSEVRAAEHSPAVSRELLVSISFCSGQSYWSAHHTRRCPHPPCPVNTGNAPHAPGGWHWRWPCCSTPSGQVLQGVVLQNHGGCRDCLRSGSTALSLSQATGLRVRVRGGGWGPAWHPHLWAGPPSSHPSGPMSSSGLALHPIFPLPGGPAGVRAAVAGGDGRG